MNPHLYDAQIVHDWDIQMTHFPQVQNLEAYQISFHYDYEKRKACTAILADADQLLAASLVIDVLREVHCQVQDMI